MAKGSEQWQAIQERYGILEAVERDSFAVITAEQINRTQERYPHLKFEARLLTHFDNSEQLPDLFKQNELCILPIQRGSYAIGHFNIFQNIEQEIEDIEVKTVPERLVLESIQEQNLSNETMGLNYAYIHGMTDDFIGEDLSATVAGRQKGGNWSYQIESMGKRLTLNAENPQIEIDAGYEGNRSIVLFEAKNSLVKQFCLRQLYFPYRCWLSKSSKQVRTVFAEINGGEVVFSEYVFPEPDLFKAVLTRSMRYRVSSDVVSRSEVSSLIDRTAAKSETGLFPQANSLLRTIDLIEHLADCDETLSKFDIAEHYGFDERQGDYYGNSAIYLGFAEKVKGEGYRINDPGRRFNDLRSTKEKHLRIVEALLERPVFREVITESLRRGSTLDIEEITPIIAKYTSLSKGTPRRRASTVKKWVSWVLGILEN